MLLPIVERGCKLQKAVPGGVCAYSILAMSFKDNLRLAGIALAVAVQQLTTVVTANAIFISCVRCIIKSNMQLKQS